MDFAIGGVMVAALVFGIVEAFKEFGIQGKASRVVALVSGTILVGTSVAITEGMLSADIVPLVELVVKSLAGGLAAMGFYDFLKARNSK